MGIPNKRKMRIPAITCQARVLIAPPIWLSRKYVRQVVQSIAQILRFCDSAKFLTQDGGNARMKLFPRLSPKSEQMVHPEHSEGEGFPCQVRMMQNEAVVE